MASLTGYPEHKNGENMVNLSFFTGSSPVWALMRQTVVPASKGRSSPLCVPPCGHRARQLLRFRSPLCRSHEKDRIDMGNYGVHPEDSPFRRAFVSAIGVEPSPELAAISLVYFVQVFNVYASHRV